MPTLFKRSNGVYYLILRTPQGARRWLSTGEKTRSRALEKVSKLDLSSHRSVRPVPLSTFINQFVLYGNSCYSKGTMEIYNKALKKFRLIVGDLLLKQVGGFEIDTYKRVRMNEVSPVTVNIDLRTLRAAFNYALRWNLVPTNPFARVPLCSVPERSPDFFSEEQFQTFFNAIKEPWFTNIIQFALHTGLRRNEIVNLQWSDVDVPRRLLRIESNGSFRTKTGKRRIVPLNDPAFELVCRLQRQSGPEWIFTIDGRKVRALYITRKFKYYARKLHFPETFHFHHLRHTFASWLVQRGASLYEVQKLLGHSSPKVTEIYSHLTPQHLHSTVRLLDRNNPQLAGPP